MIWAHQPIHLLNIIFKLFSPSMIWVHHPSPFIFCPIFLLFLFCSMIWALHLALFKSNVYTLFVLLYDKSPPPHTHLLNSMKLVHFNIHQLSLNFIPPLINTFCLNLPRPSKVASSIFEKFYRNDFNFQSFLTNMIYFTFFKSMH